MSTISELLKHKGNDVWSTGPDASVYEAVRLMAEKGIGALMVVKDTKLVGVISERDYARQVILKGRRSRETQVHEIMTSPVVFARPDQTINNCLGMMNDRRIRHLPIMDGDRILGVISMSDLVRAIITEQQITIEQLEHYISG